MIYIIIGPSGCGKTSIGVELSNRLDCGFNDADEFHSIENITKMKNGIPLNDDDRKPWLQSINKRILDIIDYQKNNSNSNSNGNEELFLKSKKDHVFTCSALKQIYRDMLTQGINGLDTLTIVYLKGSQELIQKRLESRTNHFFNPSLLTSQFDILEEPNQSLTTNYRIQIIDISDTIDNIVNKIISFQ
ncbi:hypothetical protein CYY_006677 [Polysphondylium violaceum]|uniref:gluconokinase n=1 Tax=Polysphondylium violaceum TaxID=133409 RepID=A0A8J4V5M3_9MYCE|nr:hypothetical protein CYY_006677 [Polysphondylium violaceum]